jgi:hypothetical protein
MRPVVLQMGVTVDGLRIADPGRSLAFYTAVGCEVVGSVPEPPWAT